MAVPLRLALPWKEGDVKLDDLIKQAHVMQQRLSEAQDSLREVSVVGESGAGLVKVTLNGRYQALDIELDPSLVKDELTVLEDLIVAAVNDAVRRIESKQKEHMGALARGLNLPPGFKLP